MDREVERLAEAVKEAREVHRQALPDAIGKHYKAKMAGVAKAVIPPSAKATSEATEAAVASGAAASAASAASASSSAGGAGGAGGGSRSRRASRGGAGVGAGMPLRPRASTSLAEASALLKPDVRIASFDDQAKVRAVLQALLLLRAASAVAIAPSFASSLPLSCHSLARCVFILCRY